MVKVKICGITNLEDAQAAVDAGCDALGFVFYKKSPRYISPQKAKEIIKRLPASIIKIGVFVNSKKNYIKKITKLCQLDMLQFHGDESVGFCQGFAGYKIIKAFRVREKIDHGKILKYKPFACLFDTFVKSKLGGTGKSFNWKLVRQIRGLPGPIFLSGGLSKENLKRAIKAIHPDWLDVSTSVESLPGKKDHRKVKDFIKTAKS